MTPEERLNQAESTAKKALEEVAEARRMIEKARPWVPMTGEMYYAVENDGLEWCTCKTFYESSNARKTEKLIAAGNCYRTEQEAEEVATQRQFLDEDRNAGDLPPTAHGWTYTVSWHRDGLAIYRTTNHAGQRKFSTPEVLNAFIEKWGGESAVVARLQKGWV